MSRLVAAVPNRLTAKVASAGNNNAPAKEYLERVGKYVPGEIIAAYMALNALLVSFPENIKSVSFIICFLLCLILTPIYFKKLATPADMDSLKTQQIVSFFAFIFWAYAIDGDNGFFGKEVLNIYNQAVGGALLIIFTLITGLVVPTQKP